jgi:hypothetical protein
LPVQDDHLILLPSKVGNKRVEKQQNEGRLAQLVDLLRGQKARRPIYIYENQKVLPRFFLTSNSRLFNEPSQVLAALARASYKDLQTTAYVEQRYMEDLGVVRLAGQGGTVGLRNDSSNRITLEVQTHSPSVLVITNTYSPYWNARVDRIETKVFPVNHTFQGVYVDSGFHEIILEYAPPYAIGL